MSKTNFEDFIHYNFNDKKLLTQAFTHSSFANEIKNVVSENNERLEFLGDAVLELIVSHYIFNEFKELPEGELTKLRAGIVCEGTLAKNARFLNMGNYLKLGRGEENSCGYDRDSILADTFEAVIGAIYLDGGYEAAKDFVIGFMKDDILGMRNNFRVIDCKTHLQEFIQKTSKEPIEYITIDEKGPDHDKIFVVEVKHDNKILGKGTGKSKKEAEQKAAYDALIAFNQDVYN